MRKGLDRVYDAAGFLAALFTLGIFVLMIAQTVLRQAGLKSGGMDDLVAWFCAASSFLALAHTFRYGDFVRVTLGIDKVRPRAQRWLEVWALSVAAVFTAYLTWWSASYVHDSWTFGEMSTGLWAVPMWIPQTSLVVGAALLCAAVVDELVRVLRGNVPIYVEKQRERHARGDFGEDL